MIMNNDYMDADAIMTIFDDDMMMYCILASMAYFDEDGTSVRF